MSVLVRRVRRGRKKRFACGLDEVSARFTGGTPEPQRYDAITRLPDYQIANLIDRRRFAVHDQRWAFLVLLAYHPAIQCHRFKHFEDATVRKVAMFRWE